MFSHVVSKQTRITVALIISVLVVSLLSTTSPSLAQQTMITPIDDSVIGTAAGQFNYVGAHWKHCTNCGQDVSAYGNSNSWNATKDESLTITFAGTQIAFYGVTGNGNGIAAVSIDGGAETNIDFYTAETLGDQLLWTSEQLSAGNHTFKLRVTGSHNSNSTASYIAPDRVDITVRANAFNTKPVTKSAADVEQTPLTYRVIDADYSVALDRLVMVADSPDALHIYDPGTGQDKSVKLPTTGKFVSISPDGKFVAVAHVGLITYIDLEAGSIVKTFDFPQMITDIVLAGNGFIYVEPQSGSFQKLTDIEIETGKETTSSGSDFYYGTQFKLHPDGKRLYGATQGISSGGIISVDITEGTSNVLGEHKGDWNACGKLWISQDGKRLFTGYGGVFRTASDWKLDVSPNGRLAQMKYARHIVHNTKSGLILAIPETRPTPPCPNQGDEKADRMLVYDYNTLNLLKVVTLPAVGGGDAAKGSTGYFVFINADGTKFYLILQADEKAGLPNDFAVAVGDVATLTATSK